MKLIEALHENASRDPCEVSILFTITASSSFLFFDQEHHPRNVELCSELKRFHLTHPFDKVNFITCPTTKEAMKAPSLDQPCYGEFKHFATMADTWWNFKSDQHVEPQSIASLISNKVEQSTTAAQRDSTSSPSLCVSLGGIALVVALGAILLLQRQTERLDNFEKQIEAQYENITMLEKQFQLRGPAQVSRAKFESFEKEFHRQNATSEKLQQELEKQLQEQNTFSESSTAHIQKLEKQLQEQDARSELSTARIQKLEKQLQEQNASSEKHQRDAQSSQTHIENLENSLEMLKHALDMKFVHVLDCLKILSQPGNESQQKLGPSLQHCLENLQKQLQWMWAVEASSSICRLLYNAFQRVNNPRDDLLGEASVVPLPPQHCHEDEDRGEKMAAVLRFVFVVLMSVWHSNQAACYRWNACSFFLTLIFCHFGWTILTSSIC